MVENAYFEGQRDALNGDVRIKLDKANRWMWIKSPWNDIEVKPDSKYPSTNND